MSSKRGIVFLLLAALSTACVISSFSTSLYWAEYETGVNTVNQQWSDIWYECGRSYGRNTDDKPPYTCVNTADPAINCVAQKDRMRAIRAFYVLTALAVVATLMVGSGAAHGVTSGGKVLLVVLSIIVGIMATLSWSIAVSYPRHGFCDSDPRTDLPNYRWGPSSFLMIVVSVISVVQLILAIVLPSGKGL